MSGIGRASVLIGAGIPEAEAKFYAQEVADKDAIYPSIKDFLGKGR